MAVSYSAAPCSLITRVPWCSWSELLLLELANQLVHSVPTVRIVHTSVLSDQ